jgi:ABC-2 type transport system ATP-binding protein
MDILLDLNKQGTTIMFSTHQMEEAEKIADRVLMLKNGAAALYGALSEVKQQFGRNTIHLRFSGAFSDRPELFTARIENKSAEITPNNGHTPQDVLQYLVGQKVTIEHFEIDTPSLQQIFVKIATQK